MKVGACGRGVAEVKVQLSVAVLDHLRLESRVERHSLDGLVEVVLQVGLGIPLWLRAEQFTERSCFRLT